MGFLLILLTVATVFALALVHSRKKSENNNYGREKIFNAADEGTKEFKRLRFFADELEKYAAKHD